jgi:hypothetical protein
MREHWFWFLLSIACLVWYSGITWYVTIKGAKDIKDMLKSLSDRQQKDAQDTQKLL